MVLDYLLFIGEGTTQNIPKLLLVFLKYLGRYSLLTKQTLDK